MVQTHEGGTAMDRTQLKDQVTITVDGRNVRAVFIKYVSATGSNWVQGHYTFSEILGIPYPLLQAVYHLPEDKVRLLNLMDGSDSAVYCKLFKAKVESTP